MMTIDLHGSRSRCKLRRLVAALALFAAASALCAWSANPAGNIGYVDERWTGGSYREHPQPQRQLEATPASDNEDPPPLTICGRATQTIASSLQHTSCPSYDADTPIMYLDGHLTFGRTANQLLTLTKAVQYARDHRHRLALAHRSWATDVLLQFFFASDDGDWETTVEQELCATIIHSPEELGDGGEVVRKNAAELFHYQSPMPREEYVARQLHVLRTLFEHANDERGRDHHGVRSRDMCQGLAAVFRTEDPATVKYSVIHMRYMEGPPGRQLLKGVAKATGCDPRAALTMPPDYVKSILASANMLGHPIVVITDGQRPQFVDRLRADPEMGRWVRTVPDRASWIGGDVALATLADAFVGNPASTFSAFIATSRMALGLNNNHLFYARDPNGNWTRTCGDECLLRRGPDIDADVLREKEAIMSDKRYAPGTRLTAEEWADKIRTGRTSGALGEEEHRKALAKFILARAGKGGMRAPPNEADVA